MQPERVVIALLLLALTGACVWGIFRLLRDRTASAKHELGAAACGLGALFFGLWAVNLLIA